MFHSGCMGRFDGDEAHGGAVRVFDAEFDGGH